MRTSATKNFQPSHPAFSLILGVIIMVSAATSLAATHDVTVGNNSFSPKLLTIAPFTAVPPPVVALRKMAQSR